MVFMKRRSEQARQSPMCFLGRWPGWTPDDMIPSRIVKLLTRIRLALGIWRIQRQRLSFEGLQASQSHSIYEWITDHDLVS